MTGGRLRASYLRSDKRRGEMRLDNKKEWRAERRRRVSHIEEGQGDAKRRRQMKRPGRRRRGRRGPENAERAQAEGPVNRNAGRNRVTMGAMRGNDQHERR